MRGKGRLRKDLKLIEERRFDLENMLKFANAKDLDHTKIEEFIGLIYTYTTFVFEQGSGSQFIGFTQLYQGFINGLEPGLPPEIIAEKRRFFTKLRDHLQRRISGIIDAVKSDKDDVILKIEGEMKLTVPASKDRFIEEFDAVKDRPEKSLDPQLEKRKIDKKLLDIITELKLRPDRFKRCLRCGKIFLQWSYREKRYCSQRCAGAVRQRRYEKEKAEDKGGDIKRKV